MTAKEKNTALWDESLAPQTLSAVEISNRHISLSNLWYIKCEGRRSGPYFSEDFRIHFKKNSFVSSDIFISNSHDKKWYPLTEFEVFDSISRAENDPETTLDSSTFSVLSGGVQSGLMNGNELLKALEDKKFLCTDLASTDGGKTWNKIAQYPLFAELNRINFVLPTIPNSAKDDPATEWELNILEKKAYEESVLNSIWFFGKTNEKSAKSTTEEESDLVQAAGERSYKFAFVAAVVAVILLGGLFIQYAVLNGKFSVKKQMAKSSTEAQDASRIPATESKGILSGKDSEKKFADKSKTRRSRSLDRSATKSGGSADSSDGPALGNGISQGENNSNTAPNRPSTYRKSRRSVSSTENEATPDQQSFDEPVNDPEPYVQPMQEDERPQVEPQPQEVSEEFNQPPEE